MVIVHNLPAREIENAQFLKVGGPFSTLSLSDLSEVLCPDLEPNP